MEFFEAVSRRRSVRNYTAKPVPPDVIERALDAAILAPNSSNMQTWQVYWAHDPALKARVAEACFNQTAARTAQELFVFIADATVWKRNRDLVLKALGPQAPKSATDYYNKLIPMLYGYQWLWPLKWIAFAIAGLFRPMAREVGTPRDRRETAVKSAALACENFMLAISAQGFDTCPMEGHDSKMLRRALGFASTATVVMAISVGERAEGGVWGEQYRIPRDLVVHKVTSAKSLRSAPR